MERAMQELSRRGTVVKIGGFQAERKAGINARTLRDAGGVNPEADHGSPAQINNLQVSRPVWHDWRKDRVSEFSAHAAGTGYAEGLLKIMDAAPDWTVLDVEGASGALSIPLAQRVKSVAAIQFPEEMYDHLRRRCLENGITNISTAPRLEDGIRDDHDLGRYDVVVASGSSLSESSSFSVTKLNDAARKRIFISTSVGDGPFDRRVYEATGRRLDTGPSFTYIYYNILHMSLGILADIAFIREPHPNDWNSREEALEAQKWMFLGLTEVEEQRIRLFLDENLIRVNGRWRLPYEREGKWAVMWWEKEEKRTRDRRSDKRSRRRGAVKSVPEKRSIAFE
jgi:hypothetical protein